MKQIEILIPQMFLLKLYTQTAVLKIIMRSDC